MKERRKQDVVEVKVESLRTTTTNNHSAEMPWEPQLSKFLETFEHIIFPHSFDSQMLLKVSRSFGVQPILQASRRSIHQSASGKFILVQECHSTHNSSVLAKGRSKSKVIVEDDGVEDYASDGDLFSSRVGSSKVSKKAEIPKPQPVENVSTTPKTAADLFNEQYTFVWDRLGPNPTYNTPQIRANALRRILRYSEKDSTLLEKFADLAAKWRASGRAVDRETTLEFIGE